MREFKISNQDTTTQRLFDAVVVHLFTKLAEESSDEAAANRALAAATTLMKNRAEWLNNN